MLAGPTTALTAVGIVSLLLIGRAVAKPSAPGPVSSPSGSSDSDAFVRWAPGVIALGWVVALVWMMMRFVAVDLGVDAVARFSQHGAPLGYRIAGVWAGSSTSLLFWAALTSTVFAVGLSRSPLRTKHEALTAGIVTLGLCAAVLLSGAFRTVDIPQLSGNGLVPVLEHPLMVVHPPLLYLTHALILLTAAVALSRPIFPRRLAAVALGLAVCSTLLGAWWAHDELGWGGWWAWDPVENSILAPLVLMIGALHAATLRSARRWAAASGTFVLAGVAVTRSGLPTSVHAFAEQRSVSLLFASATVALVLIAVRVAQRTEADVAAPGPAAVLPPVQPRPSLVVAISCAWVGIVVAASQITAMWLGSGDPPATLNGYVMGLSLSPLLIVLPLGILRWGMLTKLSAVTAHVGVLMFLSGIALGFGSSSDLVNLETGRGQTIEGHTVVVTHTETTETRRDRDEITLTVDVDRTTLEPEIVRYNELGTTRSRPARATSGWSEIEIAPIWSRGDEHLMELRVHRGILLVWLGGLMMAAGAFTSAAITRYSSSGPLLARRRFAASSPSRPPTSGAPASGASTAGPPEPGG